jgi:hypothetical protein
VCPERANSILYPNQLPSFDSTERGLVTLPFREYSRHFDELHVGGNDCTHYCITPSFWISAWRQIRIAVENALMR